MGSYFDRTVGVGRTLVERWSGKAWKIQRSPNPGAGYNSLGAVAATSQTNARAVGGSSFGDSGGGTVIEHWNGAAWKVQTSPSPGALDSGLSGVAATSSKNAWAVGSSQDSGDRSQTLIVHWNGKAWKIQPSLNPGGSTQFNDLFGVAATSAGNAWAVGDYEDATGIHTLVEHWNGKAWEVQPSPNAARENELTAVAATSSTNAWAVGNYLTHNGGRRTLVEHWNGKAWKIQPSPNTGASHNYLVSVAAISSSNVWAVGSGIGSSFYHQHALVEHWNGKAWKIQKNANSRGSGKNQGLNGVAATSSSNVWAIGMRFSGTTNGVPTGRTLAQHWSGSAWSP